MASLDCLLATVSPSWVSPDSHTLRGYWASFTSVTITQYRTSFSNDEGAAAYGYLAQRSTMRANFSFRREAALGRVLINSIGEFGESLETNSSRDRPVCLDNVSNTSGPIARSSSAARARFVGPGVDPRFCGFALTGLLELLQEFAQPTTENSSGAGAPRPSWPSKPPMPPCSLAPGLFCPAPRSISAILSRFW